SHGQNLYQTHANQRARAALDPGVAYIMAQIMSDDQNRCMIFGCNSALHWSNRTVAAKTGTTDNFKGRVTVAFTPDLAAAIWVGGILDNNHVMIPGSDGVYVASPGMHSFIDQALGGFAGDRWYTAPADVVKGANNSWFLSDTQSISRLPGDNPPSPTPTPVDYNVPPAPGDPVLASPSPSPQVCIPPLQPPWP